MSWAATAALPARVPWLTKRLCAASSPAERVNNKTATGEWDIWNGPTAKTLLGQGVTLETSEIYGRANAVPPHTATTGTQIPAPVEAKFDKGGYFRSILPPLHGAHLSHRTGPVALQS
ncbi:hypothetical protein GCM10027044_05860 [Hymenobacter ruber]